MKLGKWTLAIAAVALILCGTTMAQTLTANRICIHNGSDYYTIGYDHSAPNCGGGRYFPSFAHAASTEYCDPGSGLCYYPWKILGWMIAGMQAANYSPNWHWSSVMVKSVDNPYSSMMTFMYPALFTQGFTHSGSPPVVYNLECPSSLTLLSGAPSNFSPVGYLFPAPCSMGGFDNYMNIIALAESDWTIPSTAPYYGWLFAWTYDIASPLILTSNHSIWTYAWENTGALNVGQYNLLDGNSMDCTGTLGGNKGRNYSLIGADAGGIYYWQNACTGGDTDWCHCVLVKDAVTIPVNVNPNGSGVYGTYGFDVGSATLTPYATSGLWTAQALFESVEYDQHVYGLLASIKQTPSVSYGMNHFRVPGVDFVTDLFIQLIPYFQAQVNVGLPAAMFGTTVGGYTIAIPAGPQPNVYGLELQFFGWDLSKGPPTAAFTATFF